jgi:phenylacetate-CoA ligase
VGYAGALKIFAACCRAAGVRPRWRARAIVSSAEVLDRESVAMIEDIFGGPVFDRYASRELGFVAHECALHEGLHILEHGKYVEILDGEDQPVCAGDLGRIVVTDLWNVGFPMIRYETGDVGSLSEAPCRCSVPYRRLNQIAGRVTDFLIGRDGRSVSGIFLPHLVKEFPSIERFQARQALSGEIELCIVVPDGLPESERSRLLDTIHSHLPGTPIAIKEVAHIVVPPSGKHRPVVSELSAARLSGPRS